MGNVWRKIKSVWILYGKIHFKYGECMRSAWFKYALCMASVWIVYGYCMGELNSSTIKLHSPN